MTNVGVSPDDAFRPSMSMKGTNFRASIRKSMGNYVDPSVAIASSNENRDSITISPMSKSFNTSDETVTNPMVEKK